MRGRQGFHFFIKLSIEAYKMMIMVLVQSCWDSKMPLTDQTNRPKEAGVLPVIGL